MRNKYTVYINRGDEREKIEIFINGSSVCTRPYKMTIEDAVIEMIDDIGDWDYNYLKELIEQGYSLHPGIGI